MRSKEELREEIEVCVIALRSDPFKFYIKVYLKRIESAVHELLSQYDHLQLENERQSKAIDGLNEYAEKLQGENKRLTSELFNRDHKPYPLKMGDLTERLRKIGEIAKTDRL